MANTQQIKVNLAFTADTKAAKQSILDLQTALSKISTAGSFNAGEANIKKAAEAAKELSIHLTNAYNANTGNLDLSRLNKSLTASKTSLSELSSTLMSIGPEGQQAFLQLANSVAAAERPIITMNSKITALLTSLKNTLTWQISSSLIHGVIGSIQTAYGYAQDLNESLNNIRIVTGQSAEQMAKFAEQANKAAKALSATTLDYTDAALIYYQQGLSDEEVKGRTEVTIKLANVARESAETVSDQLTSIWNNFYDGSKSLEYYADVLTKLGAATASSTDEIAGGLEKFSAVAQTIGLSYEYATSALATITSNTRESEDVVGTALKTIFSRIQGLNLGETLDDGTTLNKYSAALKKVGVDIFDANGQLKDMDDILDEMAIKWQNLERAQKVALAQTVAGTRQYNQLMALMENWFTDDADSMVANLGYTDVATGELQKQADIYAESWEAAGDRVQASLQSIYTDLIDDKFFIKLTDGFSELLDSVDAFIDGIGGIKTILMGVATYFLSTMSTKIQPAWQNFKQNLEIAFTGRSKSADRQAKDIDKMLNNAIGSGKFTDESEQYQLQANVVANRMKADYTKIANELTDVEKQRYQMEMSIIEAQQKEVAELIKKKQNAEEVKKTADEELKIAKEQLNTISQIEKLQNVGYNASQRGEQEEELKRRYKDAQAAYLIQGTRSNEDAKNQAWQEYSTYAEATNSANSALERMTQQLQQAYAAQLQYKDGQVEVASGTVHLTGNFDSYVDRLQELYNNLGKTKGASKAFANAFYDLASEIRQATGGMIPEVNDLLAVIENLDYKNINTSNKKNFVEPFEALRNILKDTTVDANQLERILRMLGQGKTVDNIKNKFEQASKAQVKFDEAGEKVTKTQNKVNEAVKAFNPKHIISGSEAFMKLASVAGQAAMAFNSVKSIFTTLNNEDISGIEKFTTVLMSVSMLIPTVISGGRDLIATINGLKASQAAYEATQRASYLTANKLLYIHSADNQVSKEQRAQILANQLAKKGYITEEEKEIYIKKLLDIETANLTEKEVRQKMVEEGLIADKKNTIAVTILQTIQTKLDTAAKNGNVIASKLLILVNKALKSEFLSLLLAMAPVVAVLGALAAAIYFAVKAANASKQAMEDAAHAVEQLTTYYEEAKTAAEDLKSAISDWDDSVDALDNLIKGTDEYKEALEKANEQAKELIETYGLYSKFHYDENGLIVFDEGALEEVQTKYDTESQMAQSALYGAKAQQARTIINYNEEQFDKSGNSLWSNLQTKNYVDQYKGTNAYYYRDELREAYGSGGAKGLEALQEKINELGEHIDLSEDSVTTLALAFDKLNDVVTENTEIEKYYTQQQFKAKMSEESSAWIAEQANENAGLEDILTDAYAMAQTNQYTEYAKRNTPTINSNGEFLSWIFANGIDVDTHLGGIFSNDLNDKSLAKIYAEQVLGWTEEEVANASYEGGTGKVKSLVSADGSKKIEDISDQYMREQIVASIIANQFSENKEFDDEAYRQSVQDMLQATSELGIEGLGSSILTSLTQGEKVINVSDLINPLSPEDAEKLKGMDAEQLLKVLGLDEEALAYYGIQGEGAAEAWAQGFVESISNYDPLNWYLSSAKTHGETAAALGDILEAYKEGEELTAEQENQLTELEEKYNNLAYMREQGGNAYLATLREIQELEENSKIENLQSALSELNLDLSDAIDAGKSEEEINAIIDEILDTEHELKIAVKVDYESDVDQAFQIASQYDELAEYVKDGLEITAETAQEIIAKGYGAMLKNAKATSDGLIKLNQQEVTAFLEGKQEEIDGSKKSQIEQLKHKKTAYETAITAYEQEIKDLKSVTNTTTVEAKKQRLIKAITKAQEIENTAQTAETTATYTIDATNSSVDNANVTGRAWVDTLNQVVSAAKQATDAIGNIGNQSYDFSTTFFKEASNFTSFSSVEDRDEVNALITALNGGWAGSNDTARMIAALSNYGIVYTKDMSTFGGNNSIIAGANYTLEDYVGQAIEAVMESGDVSTKSVAYQKLIEEQIAYDESRIEDYKSRIGAIDASIAALEASGLNLTDLLGDLGEGLGKVAERYHEITREIQYQTKALEKLSTAADRAYGKTKLSYLDQEISKQERILELQKNLLDAAKVNLVADAVAIQEQFGNQATFDPVSHELTNYTALYNAAKTDEQIELLEQYEETLDKIQEQESEILNIENQIQDLRYDKIEQEIELKISLDDSEIKYLDHLLERYEDDFYKRSEVAALTAQKAPIYKEQLEEAKKMEEELNALYAEGKISQADYIAGLEKVRDTYYDNIEALEEIDEIMKTYYSDTLVEAKKELEEYTDGFEHLNKVVEYYADLADILGMSKDYDMMGDFLHGQSEIAKDEMDVASAYYDMLVGQREEAKRKYDDAVASGNEEAAAQYKDEWDALEDNIDEAQEEMLEKTKVWAEAMKKEIQNNLDKAAQSLENSMAGEYYTFDTLLDSFDKLNTQQEEFYTKTNQIYETNKLMRTANKALDEADNKAAKQKLKNFIAETQNLQNKTKLSKYELEIQQAKYDLLLAEIALEEAQNAKSTVRLSRDSEGNFGYVYTADSDAIDDAQQTYEDKENALYNKSLEGQQNYTEKYLQAAKEMQEELASLNESWLNGEIATQEEYELKRAQILEHYLDPDHGILSTYSDLYNVAVQADTQATADYWGREFGNMTGNTEQWKTDVNRYLGEVDTEFDVWAGVSETCNERTGNAFSGSKEKIDAVLQSSKDLKIYIEETLIPKLDDEITKVGEVTQAYNDNQTQIQNLIGEYGNYIDAINKAIEAESKLDRSSPDTTNTNFSSSGGGTVDKNLVSDGDAEGKTSEEEPESEPEPTLAYTPKPIELKEGYTYSGSSTIYPTAEEAAWAALQAGKTDAIAINHQDTVGHISYTGTPYDLLPYKIGGQTDAYRFASAEEAAKYALYTLKLNKKTKIYKQKELLGNIFDILFPLGGITSAATGGYTGEWGPEGKLAVLHQKEIVLNADDTENLLKSVSFVRELANMINMRASSASAFTLSSAGISNNSQTLEQNVTIHAEFPNATDHNEIEEAFNNLVNRASQYANRK